MKKTFKYFFACWLIVFAVFNIITFAIPKEIAGMNKFGGSFWTGYIFIVIAFLGQLGCAYKAFKKENLKRVFYNISLISISYTGLIAMLIAGSLCMIIPDMPNWISVIICILILAFSAISVIKATLAADIINDVDKKIKDKTLFIKSLMVDAEHLVTVAGSEEIKTVTKKVYEALKYSDPMSDRALNDIEEKMQSEFNFLSQAVNSADTELAESVAKGLLDLIDIRNKKCKVLK